jgi:hydroxymethylglutaryl-CoA reductase (NADPH)
MARQSKLAADSFGVQYNVENRQAETIGQMKSSKWMVYAARGLFVRFWDLAKVRFRLHMLRDPS